MINNEYTLQHTEFSNIMVNNLIQKHQIVIIQTQINHFHRWTLIISHNYFLLTKERGGRGTWGLTSQRTVYISVIYSQSMTRQSEKGCCQMEN